MSAFRPWGSLDWVLDLASPKKWSFLGCLGPEPRSVSALIRAQERGNLYSDHIQLIQVHDENPQDEARESELIALNQSMVQASGVRPEIRNSGILDSWRSWIYSFDHLRGDSVMLDISSMPKRFFFMHLKQLLLNPAVRNLMLCYTIPSMYTTGALSGDPEDWELLPGFLPDDPQTQQAAAKRIVVNVGFMPDGLLDHLGEDDTEAIAHLIVPFPAPTANLKRTWRAVRRLANDPNRPIKSEVHRVAPQDLPEAFDRLVSLSGQLKFPLSLAPFGPKPISAAMCLYAAQTGMPVYYAQPKTYAPDYSTGVSTVLGYWVKHEGLNLYSLT